MRMRMLGDGHSVCFYASNEVNNMLLKISPSTPIGSFEVIKWTIENTIAQTIENFLNWAVQGLHFFKREAIYVKFQQDNNLHEYAQNCTETEVLDLNSLYASSRVEHLILDLVKKRAEKLATFVNADKAKEIIEKVALYVRDQMKFAQILDEERELEFQVEQEEEEEIYRPISNEPLVNSLENDVVNYAKTGLISHESKSLLSLAESFLNSSISSTDMQTEAWSSEIGVTKDYCRTVKILDKSDDFLRTPRWLAISNASSRILLLSSFEANKLYTTFKINGCVTLAMLLPRVKKQQDSIVYFHMDRYEWRMKKY